MRYLVLVFICIFAALYFTIGVRIGVVGVTPSYMLNATGIGNYQYVTYEPSQQINIVGSCSVSSGKATFTFYDPRNRPLAIQQCSRGKWSLNLQGKGIAGTYILRLDLNKFTGQLNISDIRSGSLSK